MAPEAANTETIAARFDHLLEQLHRAAPFAKVSYRGRVLDSARRMVLNQGGIEALAERAGAIDDAGMFSGTDWANPSALLPNLVGNTLRHGETQTIVLETLSLLRFLAIAEERHRDPSLSPEQARQFLIQVLALNLERVFGTTDEATRVQLGPLAAALDGLFQFLLSRLGTDDILSRLVDEIWRILEQRPLQVAHVKSMVVQIAVALSQGNGSFGEARIGAERLISALFGPTRLSADDPGLAVFRERLATAEDTALDREASGFARAMHDTGLVSDYHADFIRWLLDNDETNRIPLALGLSSTGLDALRCYEQMVHELIEASIFPQTSQSVIGLALVLERGILYSPPIAPSLWRMMSMPLLPEMEALLQGVFGNGVPARAHLIAGTLDLLGQPLGIGQGNNPTCQSARALSMWALNDPDYMLYLLAHVCRTGRIVMHFEGQRLDSGTLPAGLTSATPLDTDPVSTLLVPHLDRIYAEMGRLCIGRGEDPHKWVNPELHGWWVSRSFHIAVDINTGMLKEHDRFIRRFHAAYHPAYNGNQPVIHPQPAGIAITDSLGHFVGWHAISLIRVALDRTGHMRAYFFNPNNDGGQDWGHGVKVSTSGHGERHGESSLPFDQFASRLYIFHDDEMFGNALPDVEQETVDAIAAMAKASWAAERVEVSEAAEPAANMPAR